MNEIGIIARAKKKRWGALGADPETGRQGCLARTIVWLYGWGRCAPAHQFCINMHPRPICEYMEILGDINIKGYWGYRRSDQVACHMRYIRGR